MPSLLVRNGVISFVLLLAFAAFTLLGGRAVAGDATAGSKLRPASAVETRTAKRSPPVRFTSHHEDDEADEQEHNEDYDDEDEDLESEIEEIEVERIFVEMERASIETLYGAMELVQKISEIASDDDMVAAFAVTSVRDIFDPQEAEEFLLEVAERAPSVAARRVARLQLAELYGEEDDLKGVRKQLRALIFAED